VLLPDVEGGVVRLIGATTHNPFFFVNSPLVSRSQIFELRPLTEEDLLQLLKRSVADPERGLGHMKIRADEEALAHLARIADGDARKALNSLEIAALTTPPGANGVVHIDLKAAEQSIQRKAIVYDDEDAHYDTISAFIKSMRGSDPNAAVYWLARMIEGGEDVKFIARRLVISASEDIGNANPNALLLANASFDAVNKIGYPEANIILSQCTSYLASSPKSNAAVAAIGMASEAVKKYGDLPVPLHIRNAPTKLMKNMGYGTGYQYSHSYENNFSVQEYLPDAISGTKFYDPGKNAREEELRKYLRSLWKEKYGY